MAQSDQRHQVAEPTRLKDDAPLGQAALNHAARQDGEIAGREGALARRETAIASREKELTRRETEIAHRETEIARRESAIARQEAALARQSAALTRREAKKAHQEVRLLQQSARRSAPMEEAANPPQGIMEECSMCGKEIRDAEIIRCRARCHEPFHGKCINAWLRVHKTCPVW